MEKRNMYNRRKMGELAELLTDNFPHHLNQEGRMDVTWLAEQLEVTEQTVYNWFKKDKLPYNRVLPLIELAKGRICVDELMPFVLR